MPCLDKMIVKNLICGAYGIIIPKVKHGQGKVRETQDASSSMPW